MAAGPGDAGLCNICAGKIPVLSARCENSTGTCAPRSGLCDTLPMTARPAPDPDLVRQARSLIGWLITQLTELLAPGYVTLRPALVQVCRHFLVPAETALRRLIHLIAAGLDPVPAARPGPAPARTGLVPAPPAEPPPRRPHFRLTEPLPGRASPRRPGPVAHPGPRIRNFDEPVIQPPVRLPPDASAYEARLLRRLAALKAAFAQPARAARRLQRLAQRLIPEKPVLSMWRIPGYTARPITDKGRQVLDDLNTAVARTRTDYHDSG